MTYQADKRDFSTGHTFLIDQTEISNEYTNFAELIKAIKADPTGDFILAADLDALGLLAQMQIISLRHLAGLCTVKLVIL